MVGAPMTDDIIFNDRAADHDNLPWERKEGFRRRFIRQANRSFILNAGGMAVIAFALPLLLLLTGTEGPHYSISHYYWGGQVARSILVGSLWTTGFFLIFFQALSRLENLLLRVAGVAAIGVAMCPMTYGQCGGGNGFHFGFAAVFFLCLATVSVFLAKTRVKYIIYPPLKKRLVFFYNLLGGLMIILPASIAAARYLPEMISGSRKECDDTFAIFVIETIAIWAFAGFWVVKVYEYRKLLGVR